MADVKFRQTRGAEGIVIVTATRDGVSVCKEVPAVLNDRLPLPVREIVDKELIAMLDEKEKSNG